MLVLSRKQDSAVHIGPDIKVKVLSLKRQAVKLGIEAPESFRVWRDELAPWLDEQQQAPASNQSTAGMRIILVSRLGQFWVGDCFARRSFNYRTDDIPAAPSDDAAATDRGKRILLADDDAGHVTLIKRALRRENIDCTVDVVHNGVEAIDYLFGQGDFADRQPTAMPDLMLLDLNMPEMNGLQVLQMLRNARSQGGQRLTTPPVVVLTSSDEDADVNDSYDLGAHGFIRKPVDHGRFAHAVQQTTQYWLGLNKSRSDEPSRRTSVPR